VSESDRPPLETAGVRVLRNVMDLALTARWLQSADVVYFQIGGTPTGNDALPATVKSYRPTASSMLLESIAGVDEILEFLTPLHNLLSSRLGEAVVWNAAQAWLRRQFPPHFAPPYHHPHGWHQDGALGFDFATHPEGGGPEAVLEMLTAWVPLTPCGRDAPGLEWIAVRPDRLLGVNELADERLRSTFAEKTFVSPELRPGDAVLMWGDVLHRTHVTRSMQQPRTSVEFRFHSADDIPARLAGERFLECW